MRLAGRGQGSCFCCCWTETLFSVKWFAFLKKFRSNWWSPNCVGYAICQLGFFSLQVGGNSTQNDLNNQHKNFIKRKSRGWVTLWQFTSSGLAVSGGYHLSTFLLSTLCMLAPCLRAPHPALPGGSHQSEGTFPKPLLTFPHISLARMVPRSQPQPIAGKRRGS